MSKWETLKFIGMGSYIILVVKGGPMLKPGPSSQVKAWFCNTSICQFISCRCLSILMSLALSTTNCYGDDLLRWSPSWSVELVTTSTLKLGFGGSSALSAFSNLVRWWRMSCYKKQLRRLGHGRQHCYRGEASGASYLVAAFSSIPQTVSTKSWTR